MKTMILALALATLGLSACNSSSDFKSAPVQTKTYIEEVNETDYRVCNQGVRTETIEGQWRRDSRVEEMKLTLRMELRNGKVSVLC